MLRGPSIVLHAADHSVPAEGHHRHVRLEVGGHQRDRLARGDDRQATALANGAAASPAARNSRRFIGGDTSVTSAKVPRRL